MSWFPQFTLNDAGQVQATTTGTVTQHIGPQAYVGSKPLVSTAAIAATDNYVGGTRYSSSGALRITDATLGLPTPNYSNGGFRVTSQGRLCITTGAGNAYTQGIAVTNDGRMCMAIS